MAGTTPVVAITTFNIDRYTTVEAFLDDYRCLGLDTVELNGRVRQRVIDDLLPYIDRGEIKVSSLHIYCPRPDLPDLESVNLAALDEAERRQAVAFTQRTLATAHRVGARAVVLHAGHMPGLQPWSHNLLELYRSERGSARYLAAKEELVRRRREECPPHLAAAERSLVELAETVAREGWPIMLGLENNVFRHVPVLEEYEAWFERHAGAPIGLWFDIGHGQVLQNLGLGEMSALLSRLGDRLIGLHLHDCLGVDDHLVPGTGEVDFTLLAPYLRPDVLRVLEYGGRFTLEKIREGIAYLRGLGVLGP